MVIHPMAANLAETFPLGVRMRNPKRLLSCLLPLLLLSCHHPNASKPSHKHIEIEINPNVEIVAVISDLAHYWENSFNHIIRAVEIRMAQMYAGEERAKEKMDFFLNTKKFIYLPAMVEAMKAYENSRDRYKAFSDYFPELMERVFKDAPIS